MKRVISGVGILLGLVLLTGSALAATGGPDGGGYTFIDNNTAGGPVFSYESITSTGTLSTVTNDDDSVQASVPFGFTFRFYGTDYTSANLSSNGFLRFDSSTDSECCTNNGPIPTTDSRRPESSSGGTTWIRASAATFTTRRRGQRRAGDFIVEWDTCHNNSPTNNLACKATFEMILFEATGQILFQYLDTVFSPTGGTCNSSGPHLADNGAYASVGIQQSPTIGLGYSTNGSRSLTPGLAVCFAPSSSPGGVCRPATPTATPPPPERPRVNVGGAAAPLAALADQAQENRSRAAAAAVSATVVPPRTGTGITIQPPNTGDAGLRHQTSTAPSIGLALTGMAGALLLGLRPLRR